MVKTSLFKMWLKWQLCFFLLLFSWLLEPCLCFICGAKSALFFSQGEKSMKALFLVQRKFVLHTGYCPYTLPRTRKKTMQILLWLSNEDKVSATKTNTQFALNCHFHLMYRFVVLTSYISKEKTTHVSTFKNLMNIKIFRRQ